MNPENKPSIFISYSRREVPFVSNLVDDLEDTGYPVWLDYRSLIPGTPWAGQIDKGIVESEIALIVVSKASISSKYVEIEWRRVLEQGKRVILVIFEAVDLPEILEPYEWVDFRGSYKAGLRELMRQVNTPEQENHPVPETNFKVPAIVWITAILSALVGIVSLVTVWTGFIPFLLFPLAYRVFKRDFNYNQVRMALFLLPFTVFMTGLIMVYDEVISWNLFVLSFWSIPLVFSLLLILRSKTWQRWGKPMATKPTFPNLYRPNNPTPTPVPFYVDHAPQDQSVANKLIKTLHTYKHPQVEDIHQAEAVFVLISNFKTATEADPQKQVVYPVILQTTPRIQEALTKVQWIDFRVGLRNLTAIAQLLPNPAKLLKALGIRPMGHQLILPPIIQYSLYYYAIIGFISITSWGIFFIQFFSSIINTSGINLLIFEILGGIALLVSICVFMINALVKRTHPLASIWFMVISVLGLNWLINEYIALKINILSDVLGWTLTIGEWRGLSVIFPVIIYYIATILLVIFSLIKWQDLRHWFPSRSRKNPQD